MACSEKDTQKLFIAKLSWWVTLCLLCFAVLLLILVAFDKREYLSLTVILYFSSFFMTTLSFFLGLLSLLILTFRCNTNGYITAIKSLITSMVAFIIIISVVGTWISETVSEIRLDNYYFPCFKSVSGILDEYAKQNKGVLPNADSWAEVLHDEFQEERDEDSSLEADLASDILPSPFNNLKVLLNENISLLKLSDIPSSTVLLSTSIEDWAVIVDDQISDDDKYIYVFLQDGSFIKYRLSDGAISLYDELEESFLKYESGKGIDLKWDP